MQGGSSSAPPLPLGAAAAAARTLPAPSLTSGALEARQRSFFIFFVFITSLVAVRLLLWPQAAAWPAQAPCPPFAAGRGLRRGKGTTNGDVGGQGRGGAQQGAHSGRAQRSRAWGLLSAAAPRAGSMSGRAAVAGVVDGVQQQAAQVCSHRGGQQGGHVIRVDWTALRAQEGSLAST